jgi:hypothetical protein
MRNVRHTASFGIVSAEINGWRSQQGRRIEGILRLDLSVYDGFSGGPLVSASGGVIGLNNSALAGGSADLDPSTYTDLKGLGPVPGIAGRSPSYAVRQLYDMQTGVRKGVWTDLMKPVVANLTEDDLLAIAAYTASLAP